MNIGERNERQETIDKEHTVKNSNRHYMTQQERIDAWLETKPKDMTLYEHMVTEAKHANLNFDQLCYMYSIGERMKTKIMNGYFDKKM